MKPPNVLALAAERDLLKLRCEWQEAIVARQEAWDSYLCAVADKSPLETVAASDAHQECQKTARAARAAYVAAGGTP